MGVPIKEAVQEVRDSLSGLIARTRASPSALALVASNIVAAILAFLHPPAAISLLFLYWAESVIVGALNIVKMYWIPAKMGPAAAGHPAIRFVLIAIGRTITVAVFVLHYGIFVILLGFIVVSIGGAGFDKSPFPEFARRGAEAAWPLAALSFHHVRSFIVNFVGRREYATRTLENQMVRPYNRVLFMFGIVFIGIFVVILTGTPEPIALLFVPAKIVLDLIAHFRDHRAQPAA